MAGLPPKHDPNQDARWPDDSGIVPGEEPSRLECFTASNEPNAAAGEGAIDAPPSLQLASSSSQGVIAFVAPVTPEEEVTSQSVEAVQVTDQSPKPNGDKSSETTVINEVSVASEVGEDSGPSERVLVRTHVPPAATSGETAAENAYLRAENAEQNTEMLKLREEKEELLQEKDNLEYKLQVERKNSERNLQKARLQESSKAQLLKQVTQKLADVEQKLKEKENKISALSRRLQDLDINEHPEPIESVAPATPTFIENSLHCLVLDPPGSFITQPTDEEAVEDIKMLEHLMRTKKVINIRYLKLCFVGPPFVGKTTTRCRLLREFENILSAKTKVQSTLLANCNQFLAFVNGDEWLSPEDDIEEVRQLFSYLKELIPVDEVTDNPVPASQATGDRFGSVPVQETAQSNSKVNAIISRLKELIRSGDFSKFEKLVGSTLLSIHDIGGQPGFLEMLPAVIRGPAMYLLCFNMSEDLEKLYTIRFSRDDVKAKINPYPSLVSAKSTISQLLSSIANVRCMSNEPAPFLITIPEFSSIFEKFKKIHPMVAVIGTHKDEVEGDCAEKVEKVNKTLLQTTRAFGKSNIDIVRHGEEMFFPVDNLRGKDSEDIKPIRRFLSWMLNKNLENASLPIHPSWLLLGVILKNEYDTIVPMKDCLEIGKVLCMVENEVKCCLRYLHYCVGTLMYYPGLSDEWFDTHIICSPQVIFDSISKLILASLRVLHSDEEFYYEHDRVDWIEKGQFSVELISRYSVIEDSHKQNLIPIEKLIKLLTHMNLLSPIASTDVDNPDQMYFMPAILECIPQHKISAPAEPDAENPKSLFITFKCGYVPTGVFCGLITYIVSHGPNKILGLKWELEQNFVKRNYVSFVIDNSNRVTLLCHENCYEIRVVWKQCQYSLHDLCTHALSVVLYTLKSLYPNINPIMAFKCSCSNHKSVKDVSNLCSMKTDHCVQFTCDKNEPVTLQRYQEIWIGKHVVHGLDVELEVLKYAEGNFTFIWSKKGSKATIKPTPDQKTLTFSRVTEQDVGYYQCVVMENKREAFTVFRALYLVKSTDVPQVTKKTVDSEIDQFDLPFIAGYFDSVNLYLDAFELTPAEQSDVKNLVPQGTEIAMQKCLFIWRNHNPKLATFKKLLDILNMLKKESIAFKIMEYLNTEYKAA